MNPKQAFLAKVRALINEQFERNNLGSATAAECYIWVACFIEASCLLESSDAKDIAWMLRDGVNKCTPELADGYFLAFWGENDNAPDDTEQVEVCFTLIKEVFTY